MVFLWWKRKGRKQEGTTRLRNLTFIISSIEKEKDNEEFENVSCLASFGDFFIHPIIQQVLCSLFQPTALFTILLTFGEPLHSFFRARPFHLFATQVRQIRRKRYKWMQEGGCSPILLDLPTATLLTWKVFHIPLSFQSWQLFFPSLLLLFRLSLGFYFAICKRELAFKAL